MLNRELQAAQSDLHKQKRLRDDLGPQNIKLKESVSTLQRQARPRLFMTGLTSALKTTAVSYDDGNTDNDLVNGFDDAFFVRTEG